MIPHLSRAALDALWSKARMIAIACMTELFDSERFPRPGFMLRSYARGVRKRILALETMLRRLFALDAALAPAPPPIRKHSRKAKPSPRRAADVSAEDARDWRGVSFVLVPPHRSARPRGARTPARRPERYVDVTRLAMRLEALTRAMASPQRYIAKLARRLALDAPRVAALITRPRPAGPRVTADFDAALKAALADTSVAPDTS
ncbi:MAG: hypothetical protein NW203_05135 [Hyphomonadaceae bacterium]|nr:hypothetical protein [Hyphomonadaceae bacterium]